MSFLRLHNSDQDYPDDHQPLPPQKHPRPSCYWALLNSSLNFIYLDPVFSNQLAQQADLLLGKSLIQFVHPDEQASAKHDIGGVVDRKTMQGSITRIRFSRLSRIHRFLGYDGPSSPWSGANRIAPDPNYMVVDIVTNWAAEGLVLCFIHAAADLNSNESDREKSPEWSNWCETPAMDLPHIQRLYHALLMYIPHSNMSRVFQILSNSHERTLLLSWPPDPVPNEGGPTGRDFAKLVEAVEFGTSLSDAKTTCARRYRSRRSLSFVAEDVESIFVPHGSVIFACHKFNASRRNTTTTMSQPYNPSAYHPQQPSYYDQQSNFPLPPLASSSSSSQHPYLPQSQSLSTSQRWPMTVTEPQAMYHQWESSAHTAAPVPSTVSNLRFGTYPPHLQQWQVPPPPPTYAEPGSETGFHRQISPSYSYPPVGSGNDSTLSPDLVPPPRRRISPGSARDQYSTTGRAASNRPMGVLRCSSCKATQSPEWRKGPTGKKELCNACGLRYARSRAKKEGHNPTQRKRKEKTQTKVESTTPPNTSPAYPAVRRRIGEESFSTSSAGSPSGSDIYPHSGNPVLDTLTPSPSPPASSVNFVHYSPGSNGRQHYSTSNASAFYSVPSPLSHPPVLNSPHGTGHPMHEQHGNQLPPLGHISSYASRMSPMLPAASSITHSPLTSTLPPASYERERDRDRELPPAPISVEPRQPRRSILTHQ